jgi:cytochrome c oxidase subunit I+III
MFITMLADQTAFISLIFGYFFFWARHTGFPPGPDAGPGLLWPLAAAILVFVSWLLTIAARRWNKRDKGVWAHAALAIAAMVAMSGIAALIAGPSLTQLDPSRDVYSATVWVLMAWAAVHVALGIVMHAYCMARRWAGRMTAKHDVDVENVTLYWHFCALTVGLTVAVVAGFPLAVRG